MILDCGRRKSQSLKDPLFIINFFTFALKEVGYWTWPLTLSAQKNDLGDGLLAGYSAAQGPPLSWLSSHLRFGQTKNLGEIPRRKRAERSPINIYHQWNLAFSRFSFSPLPSALSTSHPHGHRGAEWQSMVAILGDGDSAATWLVSGVLTTLLTSFSEENTVIILTSRWRRSTVVLGSTGTPLYWQCQTDCD